MPESENAKRLSKELDDVMDERDKLDADYYRRSEELTDKWERLMEEYHKA